MTSATRHLQLPIAGVISTLALMLTAFPAAAQQKGWTTAVAPVEETGALPAAAQTPASPWQPATSGAALEAAAELSRQIAQKSAKQLPVRAAAAAGPAQPAAPSKTAAKRSPQPAAVVAAPVASEAPAADASDAAGKSESRVDANASLAEKYCVNIADSALDARYALQKKSLIELQQQLDKRIELLQAKTAEYQKWVARRDEFSNKANEGLVKIYTKMQPDAAAAQLAAMDEETAAALLAKIDPRNASVILNEMPAAKAATLTATIAGAARVRPDQASSTPPGDKKS